MKTGPSHRLRDPRPHTLDAEQEKALRDVQGADTGSADYRHGLRKANAPTLLCAYRDLYHRFAMNHGRVRRVVEELARRAEAAERAGSVPVAELLPDGEGVPA